MEAGATDADFDLVFRHGVIPVLKQFNPELILVSAGFDAFDGDPLGGMKVSAEGFARLTTMIARVADECCHGRLVAMTEGGYDLGGLAACTRAAIEVLAGERPDRRDEAPAGSTRRGEATLDALLPVQRPYWSL